MSMTVRGRPRRLLGLLICNPAFFASLFRCLMILASGCWLSAQTNDVDKTFESQSHGFSLQYPANWHPLILEDVFYIENFPTAKAVRGARLPQGGAGIKVLTASQVLRGRQVPPTSLSEWAALGSAADGGAGRREFELDDASRKLAVVEVKSHCCGVTPHQESLDWYFELDGEMFVGTVVYWQGDPNADKFRDTLREVVLSVRKK